MGIIKAGRPTERTYKHVESKIKMLENEKRLNVKISESEYENIKRFCFEKKISVSDYVRNLIKDNLEKEYMINK